jgi:dihydropteroate synthase
MTGHSSREVRPLSIAPLAPHDLRVGDRVLPTGQRCLVMGVVNVTPDSFSDGGRFLDPAAAVAHGLALAGEGADLLDIGGESTRPGASDVPEAVERDRVLPVIEELAERAGVPVSVDTRKAAVAAAAVAAEFAGVDHEALVVDPGIGFGKRDQDNYALLDNLARFTRLGHPVLVGTSRKAFIGRVLESPADERVEGTAATVVWAVERGARIVRVHEVAPMVKSVRMTEAMLRWGAT